MCCSKVGQNASFCAKLFFSLISNLSNRSRSAASSVASSCSSRCKMFRSNVVTSLAPQRRFPVWCGIVRSVIRCGKRDRCIGRPPFTRVCAHEARRPLFPEKRTFARQPTAHPLAFLMVPAYGALWFYFDQASFDWHGIALLATWFMTLSIQRSEYRDTQAIHAKLDELLHAEKNARNEMTKIDKRDPEEIEQHRKSARAND